MKTKSQSNRGKSTDFVVSATEQVHILPAAPLEFAQRPPASMLSVMLASRMRDRTFFYTKGEFGPDIVPKPPDRLTRNRAGVLDHFEPIWVAPYPTNTYVEIGDESKLNTAADSYGTLLFTPEGSYEFSFRNRDSAEHWTIIEAQSTFRGAKVGWRGTVKMHVSVGTELRAIALSPMNQPEYLHGQISVLHSVITEHVKVSWTVTTTSALDPGESPGTLLLVVRLLRWTPLFQ